MLALTRKLEEGIIINGNITIKVLGIQDGKVRLGIEAPKEVSIFREEVYVELQESNKDAIVNKKLLTELQKIEKNKNEKSTKV